MEWQSGNIFIRPNPKLAGQITHGHTHNFDHTTIFFTGKWRVKAKTPDGRLIEQDFTAPAHALIKADVEHEIECLEPGEFWCVYAHRDPQGQIVQEYSGWRPGYV